MGSTHLRPSEVDVAVSRKESASDSVGDERLQNALVDDDHGVVRDLLVARSPTRCDRSRGLRKRRADSSTSTRAGRSASGGGLLLEADRHQRSRLRARVAERASRTLASPFGSGFSSRLF